MNVVDEPLVLNEPLVLDEKLVLIMIVDELVLHMVVVMEEMCKITKELVKAVGDTMMNCIKVDDCCSMEVKDIRKSIVGAGNEFVYDPNPFPYDNTPDFYDQPPQPQYESYLCELCGNDSHFGYDCPPRFPLFLQQKQAASIDQSPLQEMSLQEMEDLKQHYLDKMNVENMIDELKGKFNGMSIEINKKKELQQLEQAAKLRNEELSTIPKKESDEFIKSRVEDLVPIPSESEDTSESDSDCDLPSCGNFSPINVFEEKSMTFSNPLFDSNDDFTSSDDESLSDEDVPEENVKIYSNPFFEFDDEYISSNLNPLFDEVLENIESKNSYVSNLDESALLVTPLSDVNEDECFDPGGDEIKAYLTSDSIPPGIDGADFDPEGDILLLEKLLNDDLSTPLPLKELYYEDLKVIQSSIDISPDFEDDYHDSEGDIIYLESLLINDTIPYLPPEVFLDHDPKRLSDNDNLKSTVKVFDLRINEKNYSPTYVSLTFEDRHYLSFTYVIQIFLPYFTYPVDSFLPRSSGSEDIIFDPDISAFHFSSLKPVAYKCLMEVCSSTCFIPNITVIWGESS
ncbi:hypothetical protein Tco_1391271 [Tanacetum coccineum]